MARLTMTSSQRSTPNKAPRLTREDGPTPLDGKPSGLTSASSPARRLRRRVARVTLAALVAGALLLLIAGKVRQGAEAYVFGYPLVIVGATRDYAAQAAGPENALYRMRRFPDASFDGIVRPNVDTLYTTAFIDMARGPWVFEMAPNDGRYQVMQLMDAWTHVFASLGTRTTGGAGGRFLLAGPGWRGEVPPGLTLLRAPTNLVWLIDRIQTNGAADYATVHSIQDRSGLRTLADWQAGRMPAAPVWQARQAGHVPAPPLQMQQMSSAEFFTRLAGLMADNPAAPADAPALDTLARLGIRPGQPPASNLLDRAGMNLGRWLADLLLARAIARPSALAQGWATPPANLGAYGTDYKTRAAVARVGLGANLPADAIYPNTRVDARGDALDGSRRYRLHFDKSQLPPVRAFWSITAYGPNELLIDNPPHRYALGDRDPLVYNADGSLDLSIQADAPNAPDLQRNWLPVKRGAAFLLNARLYWPKDAALDGRWTIPAVERVD